MVAANSGRRSRKEPPLQSTSSASASPSLPGRLRGASVGQVYFVGHDELTMANRVHRGRRVAGLVTFLVGKAKSAQETGTRVVPWVGPGGADRAGATERRAVGGAEAKPERNRESAAKEGHDEPDDLVDE